MPTPIFDGAKRLAVVQNGHHRESPPAAVSSCRPGVVVFRSETDTEVIPHLIAQRLGELDARRVNCQRRPLLLEAVQHVLPLCRGPSPWLWSCGEAPGPAGWHGVRHRC